MSPLLLIPEQLIHQFIAMALSKSTTIPRFLLPRLTWSSRSLNPAFANVPLEARRHRSSIAAPPSAVPTPLGASPNRTYIQVQQRPTLQPGSIVAAQRCFSTTSPQARDHHFDTLKFVQRLKDDGFTEEQSEAMMRVLSDVIEERYVRSDPVDPIVY